MSDEKPKNPFREIVQPFIDLIHAPRALWGVNLAQFLEGLVYFGFLGYLSLHFSDFIFQGLDNPNEQANLMVGVLTAGITFSMFFLGSVVDKRGVRFALVTAFALLVSGRILMSAAPTVLGLEPGGMWSPLHLVTMGGILLVLLGYGMFQPGAYAAIRKFTTPKTAAIGFAMIYAVMNLGGWFPSFAFLLRDEDFAGIGIPGVFWVYTGLTALALILTLLILTRKTINKAIATAKEETARIEAESEADSQDEQTEGPAEPEPVTTRRHPPVHLWIFVAAILGAIYWRAPAPWSYLAMAIAGSAWIVCALIPKTGGFLARHPLANGKFFFFIFALIPVQTLFTYNWLVLPAYIKRAFEGWIGDYFEIFANANPILIFIAAPIVAAVTQKRKVYNMMIVGTLVMAAPAFLLAIGPYPWTLTGYILIMTIGEAMWQPRFLQYAAEIAPEGQTGMYMGVAQLPWFLTKMLVPLLYSGWMMDRYCPETVTLLLAKPWVGKDFKTKA
jgi:MFS family permease